MGILLVSYGSPSLLPYKIDSRENKFVYNPWRVLSQIVYDQASVRVQCDTSFLNVFEAENRSVGEGVAQILPNIEKIICSGLGQEGVMSQGGVLFLAKCVQAIDGSVSGKDGSMLELAARCQ